MDWGLTWLSTIGILTVKIGVARTMMGENSALPAGMAVRAIGVAVIGFLVSIV